MKEQKETEAKEIDYFGHEYEIGQNIQIEGNVMLLIAKFLTEVIQKETDVFASFMYATNSQEIKDDNGSLVRVDADYKAHTKTSFMLTAASDNGAHLGLTTTGVKASQILNGLLHTHAQNIENKVAKKQTEIKDNNVFRA